MNYFMTSPDSMRYNKVLMREISLTISIALGPRTLAVGILLVSMLAVPVRGESPSLSSEDVVFFESRVRPVLIRHCSECHTAKDGDPEGGLSFDSRASFFSSADVAVAGKPDDSLLVAAVRYDSDLQMPPDGKLPIEVIHTLEEWVRRGLPWPDDGKRSEITAFDIASRKADHWCWHAPQESTVPIVKDQKWCRSDIDRFVLSRLESAGIVPVAEASKETLVRRASEILTGLPADPADVLRVLQDSDPYAFEQYVDKLLASPHYGERFARHWLDVTRYCESRGHEFDFPIPNAWQYRDWVIRTLNADVPYNQFVREQIAGDLLDDPRLSSQGANESVVGTGFWLLGEEVHSPVDIRQDEADRIDNRIDTFGKAFLGLALGCARCHDHKFDAISDEDYYAIAGMVMSSSCRQVPFETIEHNRGVAERLATTNKKIRQDVLPQLEVLISVQAGIEEGAEHLKKPPDEVSNETILADYTKVTQATGLLCDGVAWEQFEVGFPLLSKRDGDSVERVQVETISYAHSDEIWSKTRSTGDKEHGVLGKVDRAGRVLRTPKKRVASGVLWHRVRGHVQIVAVVDGHVMFSGPLYGSHVKTIDTKGQWTWVKQDLRRDIKDWSTGHIIHVEYAAIDGAVGVAEAVASLEQPQRIDAAWPVRMNAALASTDLSWDSIQAKQLLNQMHQFILERESLTSEVQLESATAPSLLDGNGIDQYVLQKGSAARPGDLSPRRFLEAIDGPDQPEWPRDSSGRQKLADCVLAPSNPLTSRVIVNRIWHHLFGRGIIPTTDNFGKLGEQAADAEAQALLDTLAVRFVNEGWSIKKLIRQIVTSSTWRMSSTPGSLASEKDPRNILFHHFPLRRLEGEAIRDKILAVSGRLDRSVGGASVEVFLTEFHEGRGRPKPGPRDGNGRRSVYTKIRRNFLPEFLLAFDMPVPFQAMGRRNVTNVPAQALTLMNDPFVSEQATLWAKKTLSDSSATSEQCIDRMYHEAFSRGPDASEVTAGLQFLSEQAKRYGKDIDDEPKFEAAWADFAHALINTKEFIFVP